MLEFIIIALGIFFDRITKIWASGLDGDVITIINNFFQFEYLENRGAAFGMLQGKKLFLVGFTGVVLIGMIIFLIKERKSSKIMAISLSMIISGAIGNLYDRVFQGYVIDFIKFHYKDVYAFPTFNIADILVCVGCGLMILYLIIEMINEKKSEKGMN